MSELTGVPAATLRAWERRYGVPSPARTASAYRLYSEEDVETIRKMRDLCDSGVPASEAARRVLQGGAAESRPVEVDPYQRAGASLIEQVRRFDPLGVEDEVRKIMTLGPAAIVYERALSPALHEIGELWARNEISIAQEHMASSIVGSALRDVFRLMQPPEATRTAILGCFADEEHALGLYGVGIRLASWGMRTIDLGARTPPEAIAHAVQTLDPDLVGLSTTMPIDFKRGRALVEEYAAACGDTPWLVGGRAAEDLRKVIEAAGGIYAGQEVAGVRADVEKAVAARRKRARA